MHLRSNAREELGAGGDGPCASASPGYAQLGERVIESCLGGRPGADLGVLAAGGAAESAPSVEPADKDGCTCAESTPSVAPAGKDGYTCAGDAGEELGVTEDNVDGEPGEELGAFAAGAYGWLCGCGTWNPCAVIHCLQCGDLEMDVEEAEYEQLWGTDPALEGGWRAAGWSEGLRRHGEECAQRGSVEGGGGGVMLGEGRVRVDGADEGGELEAAGGGTRRGLELLRVAEPPAADPRGQEPAECPRVCIRSQE